MALEKTKSKEKEENGRFWWHNPEKPTCKAPQPKPGDSCPSCGAGTLAFDGLFMLVCSRCQQIADSGAFT